MSRVAVYLRLGRVSNLPTVWSNVLAGAVLAGARPAPTTLVALALATSLVYVGGMFLNDAFDRGIDVRLGADRPIPCGQIGAGEVFAAGFVLLGAGVLLLAPFGGALRGGLALAAAVILYDVWHKGNPLSPVVMAACRALVYVTAALGAGASLSPPVLAGALVLGLYIVALTWWSKRGGGQVGLLIAGISLVDACAIALCHAPFHALAAALGFFLTRRWQRRVRGT